jgi:putative transposase
MVDTMGMLIGVLVHSAGTQDREGAKALIRNIRFSCPRLQKLWADGGYAGKLEKWVDEWTGWKMEIVKRSDTAKGFELLPQRWIIERTFGWLMRYRRLVRDHEFYPQTSENMIYMAMINLMLHRLAPEPRNNNYLPRHQALTG